MKLTITSIPLFLSIQDNTPTQFRKYIFNFSLFEDNSPKVGHRKNRLNMKYKTIIYGKKGEDEMNLIRAKEIASMGEMVNVQYEGEPIYIQSVDEEQGTARIFPLNNPQSEKNVPVEGLLEQ